MTKQLILKDLSKLVQRYTPKQGVLIQSLPQDEIFEYPKSDTTRIYRIKNYDVPIVEKTPTQATQTTTQKKVVVCEPPYKCRVLLNKCGCDPNVLLSL